MTIELAIAKRIRQLLEGSETIAYLEELEKGSEGKLGPRIRGEVGENEVTLDAPKGLEPAVDRVADRAGITLRNRAYKGDRFRVSIYISGENIQRIRNYETRLRRGA